MALAAIFLSPGYLIYVLAGLAVDIVALVDVVRRPDWAWQSSGQSKTLWLVLTIVGLFVCPLIIGGVYLLAIRPKLARSVAGGAPIGGYGGGQYGGGQYGGGQYGTGGQYGDGTQYGGSQYGTGGQYGGAGGGQYGTGQYGGTSGYGDSGARSTGPGSSAGPAPAAPPPGWYPDPGGSGQPRYWDGQAWAPDTPR